MTLPQLLGSQLSDTDATALYPLSTETLRSLKTLGGMDWTMQITPSRKRDPPNQSIHTLK